jgi:uncharacterized membrane protein
VSRYLLTRGFWLVLIEFTIVRLGWSFGFDLNHFVAQVIFAIGASMIALSGLVYLPRWALAATGLAMIAGHNLLDAVKAAQFGAAAPVWNFLHQPALLDFGGLKVFVLYPLIPWVGVMAAGYALGPIFLLDRRVRVRRLLGLGVAVTLGFVLLRATNLYGDPAPWMVHDGLLATALSFINCEKYPPSLLYLAMTLGPGLMLLAAFERARGRLAEAITTFGRVPFFFYITHIYLIHALAIAFSWATIGDGTWLLGSFPPQKPSDYGVGLPGIYAVWVIVVAALYPACRWFAGVKRNRREWWWTYL